MRAPAWTMPPANTTLPGPRVTSGWTEENGCTAVVHSISISWLMRFRTSLSPMPMMARVQVESRTAAIGPRMGTPKTVFPQFSGRVVEERRDRPAHRVQGGDDHRRVPPCAQDRNALVSHGATLLAL